MKLRYTLVERGGALCDITQGWQKTLTGKAEQMKLENLVVMVRKHNCVHCLWVHLKIFFIFADSCIERKSIDLIFLQDWIVFELEIVLKYPLNCTAFV